MSHLVGCGDLEATYYGGASKLTNSKWRYHKAHPIIKSVAVHDPVCKAQRELLPSIIIHLYTVESSRYRVDSHPAAFSDSIRVLMREATYQDDRYFDMLSL
jgi:hypothetical protein